MKYFLLGLIILFAVPVEAQNLSFKNFLDETGIYIYGGEFQDPCQSLRTYMVNGCTFSMTSTMREKLTKDGWSYKLFEPQTGYSACQNATMALTAICREKIMEKAFDFLLEEAQYVEDIQEKLKKMEKGKK